MPDARLARTRRSLPGGYQFGDARFALTNCLATCYQRYAFERGDRSGWFPHMTANVIEGEHFDSDAERPPVIEGAR